MNIFSCAEDPFKIRRYSRFGGDIFIYLVGEAEGSFYLVL